MGSNLGLQLEYVSRAGGPGVEWLEPSQTAGGWEWVPVYMGGHSGVCVCVWVCVCVCGCFLPKNHKD